MQKKAKFGQVKSNMTEPKRLTQADLKCYFAAYEAHPPRTTALEQRIKIGTGFHNKWYRSQREHWLGWLVAKDCEARAKDKNPTEIDAKARWQHLLCSPLMYWTAECAGVARERLDAAEVAATEAAKINDKDGQPHGTMMRAVLPWQIVEEAILSGPNPVAAEHAERLANEAFERLCAKRGEFRKLREHLRSDFDL